MNNLTETNVNNSNTNETDMDNNTETTQELAYFLELPLRGTMIPTPYQGESGKTPDNKNAILNVQFGSYEQAQAVAEELTTLAVGSLGIRLKDFTVSNHKLLLTVYRTLLRNLLKELQRQPSPITTSINNV